MPGSQLSLSGTVRLSIECGINTLMSINSSSIQLMWRPSSSLQGIDINQLSGNFTVSLYVGTRNNVSNKAVVYDVSKLNTSDSITITGLAPDTVYHTCFDSKWYDQNSTAEDNALRAFPPPKCRLLRTYATGESNQKYQKICKILHF
ncbi:unnamed protein product [Rotaria sp. Silwood2]|nr:unnamed protein product [Rotaria sp. Silwood2]CAF4661884.1 unnamed protein product [Rotaria sp. Silwood2]